MSDERIILYINHLKDSGKSSNTIDAYKRDLQKFENFLMSESVKIENFEELQIVTYTEYLMESGISKASIIRNIVTLRNLYKFLRRQGFVHEAPILYYELPHLERELPEILTVEEISKIMDSPDLTTRKGKRDRAILELLYASGIKVSELIGLKTEDVNLDRKFVYCNISSGKERTIPIGDIAVRCIRDYMEIRDDIVNEGASLLFTSKNGETITRQGIWKMLKGYQESSGIKKTINLNTLRHSFAVHLLDNGAEMKAVSEMLGHTDINITQKYEELKKKDRLQEIYKSAHPRAKEEE